MIENNSDPLSWFNPLLLSSGSLVLNDINSVLGTFSVIGSLVYLYLKIKKEFKDPPNPTP